MTVTHCGGRAVGHGRYRYARIGRAWPLSICANSRHKAARRWSNCAQDADISKSGICLFAPIAHLRGAPPELLDRYERQRRTVCYKYVQAQTMRNRADLAEKSGSAREKRLAEMRTLLASLAATRAFLLKNSMIAGLREAAAIN